MPTNRELSIILRLQDEVSKKLAGVQGAIQKFSNSARALGQTLKSTGREISQLGKHLTFLGASITGPLLLAFKNAADYSWSVNKQVVRLKNATLQFQISLANALVPTMEKFTNILGRLLNAWNSLGPVVQQQIVQAVFVAGTFLTLAGGATWLIGKLTSLSGVIIHLTSKLLGLTAAQLPLVAIMVLLAAIIGLMFKFQGVANFVMNVFEALFLSIKTGFDSVNLVISRALAFIAGLLEKLFNFLAKLPGKAGESFKKLATEVKIMRAGLDGIGDGAIESIRQNAEELERIIVTKKGSWAGVFDEVKKKIEEMWKALKNPPKADIEPVIDKFKELKEAAAATARAMQTAFSDFFFDVFTNQMKSLKEYVMDFGKQVLRVIADLLAKIIITRAVSSMSKGTMSYHSGGIVRAHSGYLASDEVPAILQTGERVLSRSQNAEYEKGGAQTINYFIYAADAQSFVQLLRKNKGSVHALMSEGMQNNSGVRGAMKKYT
jgi:hypothetical protein